MRNKAEQLIELAFGHSMADVFNFAAESAICEETCPVFGKCLQRTSGKSREQVIRYCERQLKKWWKE